MLAAVVIVAAALVGQAPTGAGGGTEAAGEEARAAPDTTIVPSSAFSAEIGLWKAPHPGTGELDLEVTGGMEVLPWRLGPIHAGLRFGVLFATAHAACVEDEGECGFLGAYFGVLARWAPLFDEDVSPWAEVAVTPLGAGGVLLDESRLVAIDLPRLAAGIDVIVPAWNLRVGAFAFRSDTFSSATPPPLADGRNVMWGGGIRFVPSARDAPR